MLKNTSISFNQLVAALAPHNLHPNPFDIDDNSPAIRFQEETFGDTTFSVPRYAEILEITDVFMAHLKKSTSAAYGTGAFEARGKIRVALGLPSY